jgi:hypothetical protein
MSKRTVYSYCNKCKKNVPIKFLMKVEGSREQVQCTVCETLFWIGGGYGR